MQSRQACPNPAWRLCLWLMRADLMIEVLLAERRVAEFNVLVERQRRIIEELRAKGSDITSAQIVFDSLCVSLSMHVSDRHYLRATSNVKAA